MTLTISAVQLSFGTQGDDVAQLQQALRALGRSVPASEASPPVIGAGTVAIVKALQQDLGVPATGVVDAATVAVINKKLANLATEQRVVRGLVRDSNGNPARGLMVAAFHQGPAGEAPLASAATNADGAYSIAYQPPLGGLPVDLRLQVARTVSNTTVPVPPVVLETTPNSKTILPDAGPLEVVDFVLGSTAAPLNSEYEQLLSDIAPLLGARTLAGLLEDDKHHDISLLAVQSGYNVEQVAALVRGHQLTREAGVPPQVLYAWLRQGLPAQLRGLQATQPDVRLKALRTSIERRLVPEAIDGKKLEDFLGGFAPISAAPLRGLLGRVLPDTSHQDRLMGLYEKHGQEPEAFWKQVAQDPVLGPNAAAAKFTVALGVLTNKHEALIEKVKARPDVKQAADVVKITDDQWKAMIQTVDVGVPANTPGATPEEKIHNYVQTITAQVEAAFPTAFFAERLPDGHKVKTFLQANANAQVPYDLLTTYPAQFFKNNPAAGSGLTPHDHAELQKFQRIRRVTQNTRDAQAVSAEFGSAQQIVAMDPKVFAEKFKDTIPPERAEAIHRRAQRTHAAALALYGEHSAEMNRTSMRVLPAADSAAKAAAAKDSIPDWETLFGPFDFCACEECAAAHGPAAYLVDVLRFLEERGVLVKLFARRGDIGDIELSCENTNTPVPLIDLVNEILEDRVAPPTAFTPLPLAPALEGDLALPVASAALITALQLPASSSAHVEALETGKRWRIWSEAFAYNVDKDNNVLTVTLRSRQTAGAAAERRAEPQYRNNAAYETLSQSVYPWNLPFDLPSEEAKVFLTHLGVSRRDLIEALRPAPEVFDITSPVVWSMAAERLGLTDVDRKIIVGAALTPPRTPTDFWGSATVAELTTVRNLLDRSGLKYAELEALVGTSFIDPTGTVAITGPADSCDTTKLTVSALDEGVLSRMHRFVRLWRALGWTVAEADAAVHALAPDPATPVLTNEILVRLDHLKTYGSQLGLSVSQTLALWKQPNPRIVLARQLGLSEQDVQSVVDLTGLNPFGTDASQEAPRFVEIVKAIQGSGFGIPQLDYLIRHQFNPPVPFVPLDSELAATLTDLGADLLKIDHDTAAAIAERDAAAARILATANPPVNITANQLVLAANGDKDARKLVQDLGKQEPRPAVRADLDKCALALTSEKQFLQRSAVLDRVSAALGLPADVTGSVIDHVTYESASALQRLMALSAIEPTLTRDVAKPQFETLEKLKKIASIVQTLDLPASQLPWLFREYPWLSVAPDTPATSASLAGWQSMIQLPQLRRDFALTEAGVEAVLSALTAASTAVEQQDQLKAKKGVFDALTNWLGWSAEDLATLIGKTDDLGALGLLNARFPEDYRLGLIVRVGRAIGLAKRLGVPVTQAGDWCGPVLTPAMAQAIRNGAKTKYDDTAWRKVVAPLQNSLRDRQREALVGYIVATEATDAKRLFDDLLIDVEMSSCQLTSRIKQAMGSVQLFAQRCLMGFETGINTTTDPKWAQWEWMKNFRVWEANRKVWMYPENWIEPELRDNKSPFFKDLENELMQSDLDNAAAEQALMRYLEKLDAVSRLQIAGMYEDEDNVLHVFGRTFHTPQIYYYRRREGITRSWTPWEKLDLDISGDHLIPVVWNRRVMLIWPIFTQKQEKHDVIMPGPKEPVQSGNLYWDVQLAWSEFQYGRWSGKNLSEPVKLSRQGDAIRFGPESIVPRILAKSVGGVSTPQGQPPDRPWDLGDGVLVQAEPVGQPEISPERISFKVAFSDDADTLIVRGYIRNDYRQFADSLGLEAARPFGEFQFFGCRKIVSPVSAAQIRPWTYPLAPTGTRFDRMWFKGASSGLALFDGKTSFDSDRFFDVSMTGDPSLTRANKFDIDVLGATAGNFSILAPHQDRQFVGDRPCFFQDGKRAFMISSTGETGENIRWVTGDLAATDRAAFFSAGDPPPNPPATNTTPPLSVLARDESGRRVLQELTPIASLPELHPATIVPRPWTTRQYTFENFHHPFLCTFVKELNATGISALLSDETQSANNDRFAATYQPSGRVTSPYPTDEVEFTSGGAYELYNWELFFHLPLLIATRLTQNRRFAEAQRWFHYIFDPSGRPGGDVPQRYWNFKPFHDRASGDYDKESIKQIEKDAAIGNAALRVAVDEWRNNAFSPHAIARLRTTAYQKTVVMKYIDNLIAWGDQLFRTNTLETINEATLLYVLAAEILGSRPEVIQRNVKPAVKTFKTLSAIGLLGNALELLVDNADAVVPAGSTQGPDVLPDRILYFCVPENANLLGYWDTVGDRLFKIRHCMNIEGQVQQLPLFEPPIDPALLVRARAAGLSIGDVLQDISASLPNYRFSVMLQKANEVAAEVKSLGSELLSVLEKRDAEALSTLRSGQELRLLQAVRDVRVQQVNEAKNTLEGLRKYKDVVTARQEFYLSRPFMNSSESTHHTLTKMSQISMGGQGLAELLAGGLHLVPEAKVGSPTTTGVTYGGANIASSVQAFGSATGTAASLLNSQASLSSTLGSYERRRDDWTHQADLATKELLQVEKQITAAEIRMAISEQELRNHDQQVDNARDVDQFLHNKFTNQDLFQWMTGRVSSLHFQSYQLAFDLAKRAEKCMQHELGLDYGSTSLVSFGYWDSLKKGLLAGNQLSYALKRLEVAYLDGNKREHELTKHISLIALAPEQLLALKEFGACEFDVPEWLFDLDTPGHYLRRLKMASLTIPCVTGPYTSIHCKLVLQSSSYRKDTTGSTYEKSTSPNGDDRFIEDRRISDAMVTSTAQNDAGLFEPNMRDERYLPFEGAGAISRWRLELPDEFTTFDYNTISDVILHLRYTSRSDDSLRTKATESAKTMLGGAVGPLFRFVSLRHEFPTEWHRLVGSAVTGGGASTVTVIVDTDRFPYFVQGKTITVKKATVIGKAKTTPSAQFAILPGPNPPANLNGNPWSGQAGPGPWTITTNADPRAIADVFVLLEYGATTL